MAKVKCSICGKEYEACNSCLEQKTFKPWRTVTDTIEHYKIYFVIHEYSISKDKEKAIEDLKNCDIHDINNFVPDIKKVIQEIIGESKQKRSRVKGAKSDADKIHVKTDNFSE